ncbi:DUF2357 domain-containing protein [Tissierella praeacuta]|uniref:DUF2357 domain-containing protein n=1 Tax=Tissierella praeacuta TaxID=43131 RepID=UPI003DA3CC71
MNEIIEVKAIKNGDVIIYRNDVSQDDLKIFEKNPECEYLVETEQRADSIKLVLGYGKKIILQEWKKYKVQSLCNDFSEDDFLKIGEFGTDNYGTLLYKNFVGLAYFKNIQLFIESYKINNTDVELMIDAINQFISNLSYDFNQPTYSRVSRNNKKISDLDYHRYLLIMNMMRTKNKSINFFSNFKLIENNPNRTMINDFKYESIHTIPEISQESIIDVISGSALLVPCNNGNNKLARKLSDGSKNYIPSELMYEDIVDSYDNAENRFIKYFLNLCLITIERFQERFKTQKDFLNKTLLEENKKYSGELKNILTSSFLKSVGEIENIPMYSTVLTRRDGYRQIFKMYLGLKSLPVNVFDREDLEELIENKSLDVLYENYCYFIMAQILSEIYKEKLDKKKYKVNKTEFSKTLQKKTNANYFIFNGNGCHPTIKLNYNKNYNIPMSYSKSYDPDISLEIINDFGEIIAIYIFDAKFKVNISTNINSDIIEYTDEDEKRGFKYDDISKMHTYKDAIKLAKGAFVLYPGTESKVYYEDDTIPNTEYQGVGAFGLRPGRTESLNELKTILQNILTTYRIS